MVAAMKTYVKHKASHKNHSFQYLHALQLGNDNGLLFDWKKRKKCVYVHIQITEKKRIQN